MRECYRGISFPFLFALEEKKLHSGFYCLSTVHGVCPCSVRKCLKSSECLWPSGPKFLWDPEVTLEKDSDMRLRSDMIGGWWWMLLKEMQF